MCTARDAGGFYGSYFHGICTVVRFDCPPDYDEGKVKKWVISKEQLVDALGGKRPNKLFITLSDYEKNEYGPMNIDQHLTVDIEAAKWLVENPNVNLCGTS